MITKRILRTIVIAVVVGSNISCDQISKHIVRQTIDYGSEFKLVDHYLTLTKVENTGAFLSAGNSLSQPARILLLTVLPLLALTFALIFLFGKRNLSALTILGICFIVGGGFGNIYDRIVYGSVTDFLHINFVIFQTGIFNLADVSIMIGMFLVLLSLYVDGTTHNIKTHKKVSE
jgi:signal peptidase II